MKKTILFGVTFLMAGCLAVTTASAQIQWTPEQKEVWKTETTLGDLMVKGDLQGAMSYFDDNFQNWYEGSHIPVPKNVWEENIKYGISQGNKLVHYTAVPVNIWVEGNYAYTDYYSSLIFENKDGKKRNVGGQNLDVLVKKGDKWLMVASMTMDDKPGK